MLREALTLNYQLKADLAARGHLTNAEGKRIGGGMDSNGLWRHTGC